MKLFICSDIHGNAFALREVLKVYREHMPCGFLCLGDVVGYGPDSAECLEELMKIPRAAFILGNHETVLLDRRREGSLNSVARLAIRKTREQLEGKFDDFIMDRFRLIIRNNFFTASHGGPISPDDFSYVDGPKEALEIINRGDSFLYFIGHTHVPAIMDSEGGYLQVKEGGTFKLETEKRYVINPGSVGQPRDNDPRTSCCIYDSETQTVRYYKLEYDIESEYNEYLREHFPSSLAERLFTGE